MSTTIEFMLLDGPLAGNILGVEFADEVKGELDVNMCQGLIYRVNIETQQATYVEGEVSESHLAMLYPDKYKHMKEILYSVDPVTHEALIERGTEVLRVPKTIGESFMNISGLTDDRSVPVPDEMWEELKRSALG